MAYITFLAGAELNDQLVAEAASERRDVPDQAALIVEAGLPDFEQGGRLPLDFPLAQTGEVYVRCLVGDAVKERIRIAGEARGLVLSQVVRGILAAHFMSPSVDTRPDGGDTEPADTTPARGVPTHTAG